MPRVVLTGANGVFGRHIAEGLVAAACDVVCVCRSEAKADALVSSLRAKFPSVSVRYELCDVADRQDIKRLAQRLAGTSIDILVNNAAITPEERSETTAGIEQQWACNVLGYQWIYKELEPMLLAAEHKPARVVNVASFYAGGLDMADPEFKRRRYDADSAYRASKQANRMQTCAWAAKHDPAKMVFFSCHPGVATSAVSLGLGMDLDRSIQAQKEGAKTPLFLCLDPNVPQFNGQYFADSVPQRCNFCSSRADVDKLDKLLEGN